MTEEKQTYLPTGTKIVGKDVDPKAVLTILGDSGAGKSHLGYQLMQDPEIGPKNVLFIVNEDVTSIYGDEAQVVQVKKFGDSQDPRPGDALYAVKQLLAAADQGYAIPKYLVTDSISGLALGTQAYFRENPIMQYNEKLQKEVHNKFAEFGEVGTGMIDYMLLLAQLPSVSIVFCTTYRNPTKPGATPELAVEGNMVPKFLTQLSTCALFLDKHSLSYPMEEIRTAEAKGTLQQSHRIVVPYGPEDKAVQVIERYLYSQGGGEVVAKGHRNLAVREKADLPAVLRKMMGRR